MDGVLLLGGLVWLGALFVGDALVGDGPMELVLVVGGMAGFAAMAVGVTVVPRRRRWRGEVRPLSTVRPPFEPGYRLKPAQVAVEERWGVTEQIAEQGFVREVGQLGWRRATVFLVGDKTGLVVDPWFLSRRAYIFNGTCHVGPSPAPAALNPGLSLRRKNGVVRISQGPEVIDLAVPKKAMPAVSLIGVSGPADEQAGTAVGVSEERLARIARADRRAARRHAFFARINARSKTSRWVAAACSVLWLVPAAGLFLVIVLLEPFGAFFMWPLVLCLGAAGVYAGRVIFRDVHEWPSDWKW